MIKKNKKIFKKNKKKIIKIFASFGFLSDF